MIRHVRIVQLDPESKPLRQPLPFLHVLPDALLALLDERFDAVFFDVFFGVDAELFADFDFDRQSMRVPASFPLAVEALHRLVAWEDILDGSGQAMARMWFAIRGRRTFEEDIVLAPFSLLQRECIDRLTFPKLQDLLFLLGEARVRLNRSEFLRFR